MLLLAGLGVMFLLGCRTTHVEPSHAAPHWGYQGQTAPEHWGSLNSDYAACAKGNYQSPIDLHRVAKPRMDRLQFDYRADVLRILNNGHTIQVDHRGRSLLRVADSQFELVQLHFHAPSEHTVAGRHYPLEVHLVHRQVGTTGNLAVVGILVEESAENPQVQNVWTRLPEHESAERVFAEISINPAEFLPAARTHFEYQGSLTTPPCTESVLWNILDTPIQMSGEQVRAFTRIYKANARPVQPRSDWCLFKHPQASP